MVTRLKPKQIRYAIVQCSKGKKTSQVASELKVTQRRIQQLMAAFRKTGKIHVPLKPGRHKAPEPTSEETQAVLRECLDNSVGVLHVAKKVRRNHDISYDRVYRIMKENGQVVSSAAKSKKRKWVRFERKYSNAMWHVDWHTMKDPRFRGLQLVTYLDDASRCIVAAQLFTQATSENAVLVLRKAVETFGTPATILSDNGSCFVGVGRRKQTGTWQPTVFEAELLDLGIELINSRPYHPQTNGKLERFHRSIEDEIPYYDRLSAYVEYYNEERLHWSLDIDNYQTPRKAFFDKCAPEAIRKSNPKWMEEDTND